ncbi:MAG: WD40 repeat domain-containing protein [Verrucomicrobiaceae bacterium]|nr:MAG: WD40 repeat domain-containing protein [Verrucomicrobiaceae bacterium]
MKQIGSVRADDNILHLAWNGDLLAATPVTGEILVLDLVTRDVRGHPGHGLGNGDSAWFDGRLATCGFDGRVRWSGRELHAGRGMIERVKASGDGKLLAAGQGKSLLVFDREGNPAQGLAGLPAAIADFAWNGSSQVAVVGAGGARMWELGQDEPFARFDWGGASLRVEWSSCGRWLATADQTASVHIYDFTRDYPLHIQGFDSKVRAMTFSADGRKLATGGAPIVTVWPCTGKNGPEGATPVQLEGHDGDVSAAAFSPVTGKLATGDGTGCILILTFDGDRVLRKRLRLDSGISSLAWHAKKEWLGVGMEDGIVAVLSLES